MKKYEFLLWDVDDTLLDFLKSERYALSNCFEKFDLSITDKIIDSYSQINHSYWKRLERGEIDKNTVLYGRFETLFNKLNITSIDITVFQREYQNALGSVFYIQDQATQLLKRLSKDFKLYLVTNGVATVQRNKLNLSGINEIVDDIFISEEIGYVKPQKDFFDRCFAKIPDFEKEKAIIIGDSLSSDIKGGNNASIATCWYNPRKAINVTNIKVDYEICNLNEIESVIWR